VNGPSRSEESLRQFLLGKVDDAERERIESRSVIDPQLREQLLAAEQSLIDDYLEERLTADHRESFLLQYGASYGERRKLRIAKSIKEYAEAQPVTAPVDATPNVIRRRWFRLEAKPKLLWRIAAIVLVALLVAVWLQSRRSQPDAQHLAMERELASLNDPSRLREPLPEMASLSVTPITLRKVEPQPQFLLRSEIRVLELHLIQDESERHTRYRAVLQKGTGSKPFNFPEIQTSDEHPRVIRLRVPTSLLSRGTYQIILSAIAADGSVSSVEEYNFTVTG
jgi:hypothetical protein